MRLQPDLQITTGTPMSRMTLTDVFIRKLQPDGKEHIYIDLCGLTLRMTKAGTKQGKKVFNIKRVSTSNAGKSSTSACRVPRGVLILLQKELLS